MEWLLLIAATCNVLGAVVAVVGFRKIKRLHERERLHERVVMGWWVNSASFWRHMFETANQTNSAPLTPLEIADARIAWDRAQAEGEDTGAR